MFSCGGAAVPDRALRVFCRWWRFDAPLSAVRWRVALVLFAAALLKTHQLVTEPIVGTGLLESRPAATCDRRKR